MSEESNSNPPPPGPNADSPHLRARIPEHVAGGTFSTGAIVMTGPNEFVLDFLQTIGRPHRVASRVIMPHNVLPQFITALRTNLDLYQQRFGPAPTPQTPPNDGRRPTPQEIYDDLKLPDEILSGVYANGVMIGHGANEFSLDFLTSFFPQSAVSARIYLASGQVPRLLDSLHNAASQLAQRQQPGSGPAPGVAPPADPPSLGGAPAAESEPNPNADPDSDADTDSDSGDDADPPSGGGKDDSPPAGGGGGIWV
ncbi:DUF3467 domain-containing protein [Roseimaritima ulvae]|uniref:DUF3467 domain-containing protein n=1 Tax=Roseimaritima ulvae TaxID=980254 RepID=A0A5B9QW76_9BACT|nr:DUF3467 domain-containing protein [Roseimaritima ulvae]QEG42159.1 hypothetical protein UC8_41930 [Roseimaritima ulvae]